MRQNTRITRGTRAAWAARRDRLQEIRKSADVELHEALGRYLHSSEISIEWFRYEPPTSIAELRDYVQRDLRLSDVSSLEDDPRARACAAAIARIEKRS